MPELAASGHWDWLPIADNHRPAAYAIGLFCSTLLFAKIKTMKKTGILTIEIGKPLCFDADAEMSAHKEPLLDAIGRSFRNYRDALKNLLNGRYAYAKEAISWHMRESCDITILLCNDGIVVRYDPAASEELNIRIGRIAEADSLELLAPLLSDYIVYFPTDPTKFQPSGLGPRMTFGIHDQNGLLQQEVATFSPAIVASSRWPDGVPIPTPPSRPPCLVSIVNEFEVKIAGLIVEASQLQDASNRCSGVPP